MDITRRGFGALALSLAALPLGAGLAGCTGTGTASGSAAGSGAKSSAKVGEGTLTVGVRADVMGFGYLNEKTKKYYGLEIDIARDMAERMGYKDIAFKTVTPENRKEMLLDGKIDAIVACYSISDTRKKNFDFSPAYYDDHVIAVVQNTSMIESINDMKGRTFGTMSGANAAPLLNIKLKEIGFSAGTDEILGSSNQDEQFDTWRLLQFPSYQELSDALEEGTVDAMVLDGAIAKTYMDDKRHELKDFEVAKQSFGVATQKGSELSVPVSEAIQSMLDDKTIADLIDKWN